VLARGNADRLLLLAPDSQIEDLVQTHQKANNLAPPVTIASSPLSSKRVRRIEAIVSHERYPK
jgi:hypothetical protein